MWLEWLQVGRAHTDLSLAVRVLGCGWQHWACWRCSYGCTWERPQHSAVPGYRPERDKVWSPTRKSRSRGTYDLRHQRRDAGNEASGALGEQTPGGQLEQHGCSSSNGRGLLILLSEKQQRKAPSSSPLSVTSEKRNQLLLDYYMYWLSMTNITFRLISLCHI